VDRHPEEIAIPEPLPELRGAFHERQRRVDVTAETRDRRLQERCPTKLDAVGHRPRVPLRPSEPASPDRRLLA
jgi:hypothetical protein